MYFSLFYNFDVLPGQFTASLYPKVEAQIILADRLGFDAVWLGEHHFALNGRMASPLLFLSRLSALTERIRLGTAVVEALHSHPVRLAEEAALLDVLSCGRLLLGVGSDSTNKHGELAAIGMPLDQRSTRTREAVTILQQAFRKRKVTFAGEHYRYTDVRIEPGPLQAAEELIWIAAGASTPEWAGAQGLRLLVAHVGSPEEHRRWIKCYWGACGAKRGYVAQLHFVYAAETEREAQEQTRATVARYARYECDVDWDGSTVSLEYTRLLKRMNMLIGTPVQIANQLTALQAEFGFDEILCQTFARGIQHEDALRSIELLGCEVLPHLQTTRTRERTREPHNIPEADMDWKI